MKRYLFGLLLALLPLGALAQVCDLTFGFESETMTGYNISKGEAIAYAMPIAEIEFYHARQMKTLDAMSKEQDKCKSNDNDCYRVDVYEERACDGKAAVRQPIGQGSASIQGMTYAGSIRVGEEALRQGKLALDHNKERAAKGLKNGWDHTKAKKVERDDLGKRKN